MAEKYEFPEELRLITDEPIEDDGWGEFSLDSERPKAAIAIANLVQFMMDNRCLLSPTIDVEKHISTLVKKRICPFDRNRGECPCLEAVIELNKIGYSKCGIFVTEKYLRQNPSADNILSSNDKTTALTKIYKEIDSGIPAILAYHGYQKKHLDILSQRAKASTYWAKIHKFLLMDIALRWGLTAEEINRVGKINKSLDKLIVKDELRRRVINKYEMSLARTGITVNKICMAHGRIAQYKDKDGNQYPTIQKLVKALKQPDGTSEAERCWDIQKTLGTPKGIWASDIVIKSHAAEVTLVYENGKEQLVKDAIEEFKLDENLTKMSQI
jgi:hypothetical protein